MNSKSVNNNHHVPEIPEEFYLCPCCGEEFDQPKILPCLHSFCFNCLDKNLAENNIGASEAFLCPICKTQCVVPARGVRAMKSNIFLITLQEFNHTKTLEAGQECEGCDQSRVARKKCIECGDWLCNQCCAMHTKVKTSKDHHLLLPTELASGEYDDLIKENFEPLMCSKHEEPLKLFCCDAACQAPICTVCKSAGGHEKHQAIELTQKASLENNEIKALLPATQRFLTSTATKIERLNKEEKDTIALRKKLHKEINERLEKVVENIVKRIQDYAESMLSQVENLSKEHRKDVCVELEACKGRLEAANAAKAFSEVLLGFNRPEELVAMSKEVKARLGDFQQTVDTMPPSWKQPRLQAAEETDDILIHTLFGTLSFEGEMIRSVANHQFSARTKFDANECALCDICMDWDSNLVIVDRDNARIKVFDLDGKLKMVSQEGILKSPNRVLALLHSKTFLIKDEKSLRLVSTDGRTSSAFNDRLKQPVGLALNQEGQVLVTEWMAGELVILDEDGTRLKSFPLSCEAPGYVTAAANGTIAVTDWKLHVVKLFDASGKFLRQFGQQQGASESQLDHPYGLCADKFNHIIVADTWNNRIVLLSEEGRFLRHLLRKEDGLEWPQGVVVDGYGRLIIAEQHGLVKMFQYIA